MINQFEVGETSNGGMNVTRGELDQAVAGLTQQLEIANKAMLTKLDSLFALQAATAKVASKPIRAEDAGSSSSSPNLEKSFQEISNPGKGKPDNPKQAAWNHNGEATSCRVADAAKGALSN